jgi:hypothetical protein
MLAYRSYTHRTGLDQTQHCTLGIRFLFLTQAHIYNIAWGSKWHEHHHTVDFRYGIAFGTHIAYCNSLKHRERFSSS